MSRFAKWVALLAVVGVAVVLITPVADELPCTARHGAPLVFALSLNAISVLVSQMLPVRPAAFGAVPCSSGTDFLSFACTFLC
jgi:hypothetical protein